MDSHGITVDQVGLSAGSLYKEGANLASLGTTNADHSYERKPGGLSLSLQDTDDNATDFQVTTPSNPQSVVLSATPASIDFGSISQLTSLSQNVAIKNLLLVAVSLDTPAISGTDSADFTAGAPSATTLAGGRQRNGERHVPSVGHRREGSRARGHQHQQRSRDGAADRRQHSGHDGARADAAGRYHDRSNRPDNGRRLHGDRHRCC